MTLCAWALVTIASTVIEVEGAEYELLWVKPAGAPRVRNGRMAYALDVRFTIRPPVYWWYYDTEGSRLVIDCYGGHISEPDTITMSKASPFRSVRITNRSTKLSLAGKQALIEVKTDPGWRLRAAPAPENTLRVIADRAFSPTEQKEQRRYLIPLVAAGIALVAGLAVFVGITQQ